MLDSSQRSPERAAVRDSMGFPVPVLGDDGEQGAASASQNVLTSTLSAPPPCVDLTPYRPGSSWRRDTAEPSRPQSSSSQEPLFLPSPSHPSHLASSQKCPGLSRSLGLQAPSSEFPKPLLPARPPDVCAGSWKLEAWVPRQGPGQAPCTDVFSKV